MDARPETAPTYWQRTEPYWDVAATVAALFVIPQIYLEVNAAPDSAMFQLANVMNWAIWIVFLIDHVVKSLAFGWRWNKTGAGIFSLVIILLSVPFFNGSMGLVRLARLSRLARLGKVFRMGPKIQVMVRRTLGTGSMFQLMWLFVVFVLVAGAVEWLVELRAEDYELIDGLWWAIVTSTTVGYGDIYPVGIWGRLIAILVMIVGIAYASVLTGQLATIISGWADSPEPEVEAGRGDEEVTRGEAVGSGPPTADAPEVGEASGAVLAELRLLRRQVAELSEAMARMEGRGGPA